MSEHIPEPVAKAVSGRLSEGVDVAEVFATYLRPERPGERLVAALGIVAETLDEMEAQ